MTNKLIFQALFLSVIIYYGVVYNTKPDTEVSNNNIEKESDIGMTPNHNIPTDIPIREPVYQDRMNNEVTSTLTTQSTLTVTSSGTNAKAISMSDNAVSLGNVSRVNGNVQVVRDDHRDYRDSRVSSSSSASTSVGMEVEDVDVLLSTTKKEINERLNKSISIAESKIAKNLAKSKEILNKHILDKTDAAIETSMNFTNKTLELKEESILSSIEGKTTILKDSINSRLTVLNQSITTSGSRTDTEMDNIKKLYKEGDVRLTDSLKDTDTRLSSSVKDMKGDLTSLDISIQNVEASSSSKIAGVINTIEGVEANLTSNIETVVSNTSLALNRAKQESTNALSNVESNLSNIISNNAIKTNETITTIEQDTDNKLTNLTNNVTNTITKTNLNLKKSIDGNTSLLIGRLQELNSYIDNKIDESMSLISTLATIDYVNSGITSIREVLGGKVDKEYIDMRLSGITASIEDTVSKEELNVLLSDINETVEKSTNRKLEVFWYYGETCPNNSLALDGGEISYDSPISDAFADTTLPDYRGKFIRNISSSTYIGLLQPYSTSTEGIRITNNIGLINEEIYGTGRTYIQTIEGEEGYGVDLSLSSNALETRPTNVTLQLCIHE